MNCRLFLQGGLSVAGWEFRVGALCGGQPGGVFLNVAICEVIPLVPTRDGYGGSLLEWVLVASVGYFRCN